MEAPTVILAHDQDKLIHGAAGALVALLRMRTGISQRQLARLAGMSASEVSDIERGKRQPTLPTLFRLIRAGGMDLRLDIVEPDEQDAYFEWDVARRSPVENDAILEASRADAQTFARSKPVANRMK